jgi:hypothetical protein
MICVITAAHVHMGVITHQEAINAVQLFIDMGGGRYSLWRTLGFSSRAEAEERLESGISHYTDVPPSDCAGSLAVRLNIAHIPDRKLAATLTFGVCRFQVALENMIRERRTNSAQAS